VGPKTGLDDAERIKFSELKAVQPIVRRYTDGIIPGPFLEYIKM
jgi:hypothetical protein